MTLILDQVWVRQCQASERWEFFLPEYLFGGYLYKTHFNFRGKWNQYIYGKYQNANINFHILETYQKYNCIFNTCPLPTVQNETKYIYIPFAFLMLPSRNAMPDKINFQNFPHNMHKNIILYWGCTSKKLISNLWFVKTISTEPPDCL